MKFLIPVVLMLLVGVCLLGVNGINMAQEASQAGLGIALMSLAGLGIYKVGQ